MTQNAGVPGGAARHLRGQTKWCWCSDHRGDDDAGVQIDIRVTGGVVRGGDEADLAVFRGIPYAAPPARFGAPQPVQAWEGVRGATTFGPPPPQPGVFGMDVLGEEGEDWLTVNVWSPDLGGGLSVMVWNPGRCLHVRHVGPARVRRQQPRPGRRRGGDLQLPGRAGRLRLRGRHAGQPWAAGPGRGPGVGAGQHRRFRWRPEPGHRLRPVRGWWIGGGPAGDAAGRPGCSTERSRRVCRAPTSPQSWPPTSRARAPRNWAWTLQS